MRKVPLTAGLAALVLAAVAAGVAGYVRGVAVGYGDYLDSTP